MPAERLIVTIRKSLAQFQLDVRLAIGAEILVLFGPSGAGKTQTLNAIAGLLTPDDGEIVLDGLPLFRHSRGAESIDLPARRRRVGMVFQQYALFPHLTARENVEYPLRRGERSRAIELLRRMRLEALADRYPRQLSGGQQQRVAIARALAAEPRVLLLDEPFSALDRPIREQLHRDLLALQEETGMAVVYVTHSLEDALTAGHRLAIIDHGSIVQVAETTTIFTRPRNRTVLEILGVPNIVEGQLTDGFLEWEGIRLTMPRAAADPPRKLCGYVPAEAIRLAEERGDSQGKEDDRVSQLRGTVRRILPAGLSRGVLVEMENGRMLEAALRPEESHTCQPGETVRLVIPAERIILATDD